MDPITLSPGNPNSGDETLLGILQRLRDLSQQPLVPQNPLAQLGTVMQGFAAGTQGQQNPALQMYAQQRGQQMTGLAHEATVGSAIASVENQKLQRAAQIQTMNRETYNALKNDPDIQIRERAYEFGKLAYPGILGGIDPKLAALKGGKEYETRHDQYLTLLQHGQNPEDPQWAGMFPPALFGSLGAAARDAMTRGGLTALNQLRIKPESQETVSRIEYERLALKPDLTPAEKDKKTVLSDLLKLRPEGQTEAERIVTAMKKKDAGLGLPLKDDVEYFRAAHQIMHVGDSTLRFIQDEADKRGLKDLPGNPARYNFITAEVERLAGARALGQYNAKLDVPMTAKEAANLRHPDTLAGAPTGMTMRQALTSGYKEVDDKDLALLAELQKTRTVSGSLFALADRLITARDPAMASVQWATLKAGSLSGQNTLARAYEQDRDAFLGNLSRSLGSERGVLTNKDIDRVAKAFPNFFDTVAVKNVKKAIVDNLIEVSSVSTKDKMFGRPYDEKFARAQIESLLDRLEHAGPPAPAVPAGAEKPAPRAYKFTPLPGGRIQVEDQ